MAYTWDANKNKLSEVLTGVNATVNGYGFNAVDTTYDFEDRLTQWKRANGAQNQSWSLTAVGDWQSQTVNGTATSRTHGPTHELTAIGARSLAYDAKGNLTQDTSRSPTQNYVWDYDNKMKSADIDGNGSADVSFEYDALGRRVARTQGANAVVYFQVDQQTICDYPRGGAAASPTYRYFWGSYIDELIARKATGTGGAVLFAHRNQQYSIYAYSNSSGAVVERIAYTAYGQPTFMNAAGTVQSTSPNSIRYSYTGREWDASLQLHHFRARWMGPVTGRFLARDPIAYEGSPFHLSESLASNPLIMTDSLGRQHGSSNSWVCCGGKKILVGPGAIEACCNNKVYNMSSQCCEDGTVVDKESLWRCVSNDPEDITPFGFTGKCFDYTLGWITCPFGIRARHSYVCCDGPDQNCFEVQKSSLTPGKHPWGPKVPGKVPGTCNEDKICPKAKLRNCGSCGTGFCFFPGPNCHQNSGSYGCGPGNWFW